MKTFRIMIAVIAVAIITTGNVYGNITAINSIDELRVHSGADGDQISLLGYYSDTPGVGGGIFYGKTDNSLADNGGTVISSGTNGLYWVRAKKSCVRVEDFGARPDATTVGSAWNTGLAFMKSLDYVSSCGGGTVTASGMLGAYVIRYCILFDNLSNVALRGSKTRLKLFDNKGNENSSFLIIKNIGGLTGTDGDFSISGFALDGNGNTLGCDQALLVVGPTLGGVNVSDMVIKQSGAKGLAVTCGTSAAAATNNVRFDKITASACVAQAVMTDSTSTSGGSCKKVTMSNIIVGSTGSAGIVVNDGTELVTLTNSIADVENSVWDAVSVRGSRDVSITNCIGSRGRSGLRIFAIHAIPDYECKNIVSSGNLWDLSVLQSGVQIIGAENISFVGDISKKHKSCYSGFGITQAVNIDGVNKRTKNVTLSSVQAFDDRTSPQQSYGVKAMASDNVLISAPLCYGNSVSDIFYDTTVTGIYVSNDGAEGATRKIKTVNIEISAGGCSAIDVTWDTPFVDDNNKLTCTATMVQSTTASSLRVHHVSVLSTTNVAVVVVNDSTTDCSGTLCVSAERK